MRLGKILPMALLATLFVLPGCSNTPQNDVAYVEDENARLKQLLIQYENDARNNQVMVTEANGRVQRTNLELEAANRKIGVYEQEIPRLRNLAVQAAQSAQASNQAQYAQYQQYVNYMNQMARNQSQLQAQARAAAAAAPAPAPAQAPGTLRQDLSRQLSSLADQFGGVVTENRLQLPGDFFFDSGKYELNPNARAAIRRMAEILAGENLNLMVVGHTDSDPIKNPNLRNRGITDNLHLSLLRAKSVVDELQKAGYPTELMYPTGYGDQRPIAPNTDRASKKRNRRVDIFIDPTPTQAQGMSDISGISNISGISGLTGLSQITGVEPVASPAGYDGASSATATVSAEPMASLYTQGYSQLSSQAYTGQPMVPATSDPYGSAYGSVETVRVETVVEPLQGGTADLIGSQGYGGQTYYSEPSTTQVYSAPPIYSAPPSYAPPAQPYVDPYQSQPFQQPQPFPQQPQPYAQPFMDPYTYNQSPGYTTTLEPIAMLR